MPSTITSGVQRVGGALRPTPELYMPPLCTPIAGHADGGYTLGAPAAATAPSSHCRRGPLGSTVLRALLAREESRQQPHSGAGQGGSF